MKDDSLGCQYLHPHFWYHGMNKIKAGKGYRNDIPLGPIGGQCSECDGDVISIKMNTSAKGFETTSEKVCNKCGLVVPGAFQTLEPKSPYKGIYYATHEQWLEAMTPDEEDDDIAWDNEQFEQVFGLRPNDQIQDALDGDIYGVLDAKYRNDAISRNTYEDQLDWELGLKSKRKLGVRAEDWNRGSEPVLKHRLMQYYDQVDICKSRFSMSYDQANEVKYIIKTRHNEFNTRWQMEDIIICLSLIVMSRYVNNGYMATIKRQIPMWKDKYSTLYRTIRSKLNV